MSATRATSTNNVITISILPRHIQLSDLRSVIDRLHLKFDLWGGKLRVSVPNTPSMRRCGQCDTLGHEASQCQLYQGVAIRLLMRDPIPFRVLEQLVSLAQCRVGYLGSGLGESKPSRRVTLLFGLLSLSSSSSAAGTSGGSSLSLSTSESEAMATNLNRIVTDYSIHHQRSSMRDADTESARSVVVSNRMVTSVHSTPTTTYPG
jgi:hypothetical protein